MESQDGGSVGGKILVDFCSSRCETNKIMDIRLREVRLEVK